MKASQIYQGGNLANFLKSNSLAAISTLLLGAVIRQVRWSCKQLKTKNINHG
jgi:hypothetical protein